MHCGCKLTKLDHDGIKISYLDVVQTPNVELSTFYSDNNKYKNKPDLVASSIEKDTLQWKTLTLVMFNLFQC